MLGSVNPPYRPKGLATRSPLLFESPPELEWYPQIVRRASDVTGNGPLHDPGLFVIGRVYPTRCHRPRQSSVRSVGGPGRKPTPTGAGPRLPVRAVIPRFADSLLYRRRPKGYREGVVARPLGWPSDRKFDPHSQIVLRWRPCGPTRIRHRTGAFDCVSGFTPSACSPWFSVSPFFE